MDFGAIVAQLDDELRVRGTSQRAISEKAYLKSSLVHYGTAVPQCKAVAASVTKRWPNLTSSEFRELCETLWYEPIHERRMAVVGLFTLQAKRFSADDLAWLEQFIRNSQTWAFVDEIARHPVALIALNDDAALVTFDRWLLDDNFWIRRSAVLGLSKLLREGRELDRFFRYGDHLLPETEFFIRKAIGWVARELGARYPEPVSAWVRRTLPGMNGVTIREAVKYLPDGPVLLAEWKRSGGSAQLRRQNPSG